MRPHKRSIKANRDLRIQKYRSIKLMTFGGWNEELATLHTCFRQHVLYAASETGNGLSLYIFNLLF